MLSSLFHNFLRTSALLAIATSVIYGAPAVGNAADTSTRSDTEQTENAFSASSLQELSQKGLHFQAMARYYELSSQDLQLSLSDVLASAQSAWALGLVGVARNLWSSALSNPELVGLDRERVVLSQAILELQEGNAADARAIAEQRVQMIEHLPIRSQFWLVIAESLSREGDDAQALVYYKKAFEEAGEDRKDETAYLLGECQYRLGALSDARFNYVSISPPSVFSGRALRRLAEIDLAQHDFEGVVTWIKEGRLGSPDDFADAWTSYAYISSLLSLSRQEEAQVELRAAQGKFSGSSSWVILANAAVEASLGSPKPIRARLKTSEAQKS